MGAIIMNTQLAKIKRIAIFLAGISTPSIPAVAYADWPIRGLDDLGGSESYAFDINDSGQVVGVIDNDGGGLTMLSSRVLMAET